MEWIKQIPLKKSLFAIAFLNMTGALFLSLFSVWGCMALRSQLSWEGAVIKLGNHPVVITQEEGRSSEVAAMADVLSFLQIALPILIYIFALFITASMFYNLKLKKPLAVLEKGASHIIENDLDFTMESPYEDEMGRLCTAFETMRKTLLENNRELWRQAEERKRLNAAFSHNLRNPITVLKGSIKLAKNSIQGQVQTGQIQDHLIRIEDYIRRIECYIETMSSVQKLEEFPVERTKMEWESLLLQLRDVAEFAGMESGKHIQFCVTEKKQKELYLDKSILFQVVENLISNALRFAVHNIEIHCCIKGDFFEFSVMDDGCGFSETLLKNGILPFQKEKEEKEHFGMGLYVSKLLCQRHGGSITVKNQENGAVVLATFYGKEF